MKVIGYVRVSTEEQGRSGLGLEAQRAAILARFEDAEIVREVRSGASVAGRPALRELLSKLERGDTLVVSKLDRLSRSVVDAGKLLADARRRGFNIVALDFGLDLSTPQGELVANVLASVAQWERRMIGQRISEALAVKRADGWRHPSWGLKVPVAKQRRIARLRKAGWTQQRIATELGMHREQVCRVLRAAA